VEQAATLRLIPNMSVWRPADAVETLIAWQSAIERRTGPTCLLLSRQNLPYIPRDSYQLAGIRRGAYVLIEAGEVPDVILIATGSELGIALTAARRLNEEGRQVRVVSMPCTDLFDRQDADYRERVLPLSCRKRIAIEAGTPDYWRKYVGLDGQVLGVPDFGESAPAEALFKRFGLTAEGIMELVRNYR
jgi:transketolase